MFGIFVTMLVGGILGYAFRSNVKMSMRTRMYSSLSEYGNVRAITDSWDFTQATVFQLVSLVFHGISHEHSSFFRVSQLTLVLCIYIYIHKHISASLLLGIDYITTAGIS